MKIVFINPPRTNFDREELAPPLGLLRLAFIAKSCGWTAEIDDQNLQWHLDDSLCKDFYNVATEHLLARNADIYGFTSMMVDSHIALELSRRLKQHRPEAKIILGGSHFSAIADQVHNLFPWVDDVLTGEAEQALAEKLKPGAKIDPNALLLTPEMLEPVNLQNYFSVNPRRMVNLETGRGCRFRCAFCYSPQHYSGTRDFSIDQVVEQMAMVSQIGFQHAWFVNDNFVNEPAHAKKLCYELESAKLPIPWSCYATLPQLDASMIQSMGRAGCTETFCGVDAVGTASERAFQKAFLRGRTSLTQKIEQLAASGIKPTFAFLVAPPSHDAGSAFDETLAVALEAQKAGADILLNPLTLYPGTSSLKKAAPTFVADPLMAELLMDLPDVTAKNPLAERWPMLFPFHSRYTESHEWDRFLTRTHCAYSLIHTYPLALSALTQGGKVDIRQVVDATLASFTEWGLLSKEAIRDIEQKVGFVVIEALAENSDAKEQLLAERPSLLCPPVHIA